MALGIVFTFLNLLTSANFKALFPTLSLYGYSLQ